MQKKTILIVDDEKDLCDVLREAFPRDCKVLVAYSGEEAIKIFEKQDPELVIMDHHMPGINGIETIKRIKKVDKKCDFIMISGLMDMDLFKKAEKLGVRYCFSKPFKLDEIKKAVFKIIGTELAKEGRKEGRKEGIEA